jgi:hypothetical protein
MSSWAMCAIGGGLYHLKVGMSIFTKNKRSFSLFASIDGSSAKGLPLRERMRALSKATATIDA